MPTKHRHVVLTAGVLATFAAAPARGQEAQGDPGAARRERAAREASVEAAIERLRRELDGLERRRLDAALAPPEAGRDSLLRALQPAVAAAARRLAALEARFAMQRADMTASRPAPAPRVGVPSGGMPALAPDAEPQDAPRRGGWVGVTFSGGTNVTVTRNGPVLYHLNYPVVVSVEPASPAERAGIEAGDTVIAYDGRDVLRRAIPLARQLRPGARLVVRVRREGQTIDVPVKVERRPESIASGYFYAWSEVPAPPALPAPPAPPSIRSRDRSSRRTGAASGGEGVLQLQPVPPAPPVPLPVAPAAPVAPTLFSGGPPTVAGAQLMAMSSDLREAFGVSGGVLVLSVAPGTPAAQSGLRAGDVIHRVNGSAVGSPQALQRVVERCVADPATHSARLDVVRRKRSERLTLRW